MAIEMVDRRVRFVWNCGAGSRAIVNNVTIETANNLKSDDHMWYKITAERFARVLLTVLIRLGSDILSCDRSFFATPLTLPISQFPTIAVGS